MIPPSEEAPPARPTAAPAGIPPIPDAVAMRARFLVDVVGGRIGQHPDTFQHRERVLRQLTRQARIQGH